MAEEINCPLNMSTRSEVASATDAGQEITPKALALLRVLASASRRDPLPAKAIARLLWPEKLRECGTSLRRGGLYRAAGAYCSKLQKRGWVGFFMDDFQQGYFLTEAGKQALGNRTDQATTNARLR